MFMIKILYYYVPNCIIKELLLKLKMGKNLKNKNIVKTIHIPNNEINLISFMQINYNFIEIANFFVCYSFTFGFTQLNFLQSDYLNTRILFSSILVTLN